MKIKKAPPVTRSSPKARLIDGNIVIPDSRIIILIVNKNIPKGMDRVRSVSRSAGDALSTTRLS